MPKPSNSRAHIAELVALRKSGKKRLESYEIRQEADLYEELDEESYKKVVRDRLNQDDFVIDDNGQGYADYGREEWDQESQNYTDSEEDRSTGKSRKLDLKQREQGKVEKEKGISNYFAKGITTSQAKPKAAVTKDNEEFLNGLLNEVENNISKPGLSKPQRQGKLNDRRRARELSPSADEIKSRLPKRPKVFDTRSLTGLSDKQDLFDDDLPKGTDKRTTVLSPNLPTLPRKSHESNPLSPPNEDDKEDEIEVAHLDGVASTSVNISAVRPTLKSVKSQPEDLPCHDRKIPLTEIETPWNDIGEKLKVLNSGSNPEVFQFGKLDYNDALEEDGSLRFFWIDYMESNGSLCLFGKVLDKNSGIYVSTFVKIDNILRKLFFLPRKQKQGSAVTVEMKDVYEEVDSIMTNLKVGDHKIKPCNRKYAFEMPNIPKEGEYLKLLYSYSKPQLPSNQHSGLTYSHVFGTSTSLFEQFVLWKSIMGPCWLQIEKGEYGVLKKASHCKLEVQLSEPKFINIAASNEALQIPPLTLMSITIRTLLNKKENKQEILAISARIYHKISITDTVTPEKIPSHSITVLRPSQTMFPIGFEAEAAKHTKGSIKLVKHERELLSFFLARLALDDPDVLIGHQLEGVDFRILLSRLQINKTPQWSRIGRMNRTQWPNSLGTMEGNFFAERSLLAGRLLCDLANDMGKSIMTKCTSWSLTEMCSLYLSNDSRRDVESEIAMTTWATTKGGLMDYVRHCEADTYFIAALALNIQMLSLTKVLTNLAGNSWARTLTGTRAERNEYILLHEFHKNKYICPDKSSSRGRSRIEVEDPDENSSTNKKDKYKGGLVFEPEKGLYDKFVLVMDFNSLYPSIIQEYNICFTTVERSSMPDDEESIPDVPKDQELGILPKLIATLVSRRRQVKSLMKDKNATSEQLATWDIKQLALKLTANSMYGCLGYRKSRFYARPLAVLTTYKGREILQSTKELAESNSFQVIYGDTDSVMINANVSNIEDALKVGNEFRKAVNERYKLLEIDIDNIFRRILLQAKKKYAAINLVQVEGRYVEKLEVKGLDMKRREYCNLSKEVSSQLLKDILSGDESEIVITRIHDYLREVSENMRNGGVPISKYTIFTKLGKSPKDYPNAESMPQVQVALREMSRGKTVRKDDVISYIVTTQTGDIAVPVAKRSYSPQDLIKDSSNLSPDIEWYLYKQIFPPVERLCANISGTDTIRLADCLGLDVRKYQINNNTSASSQGLDIHPLESQIDDETRFRDACRLTLRCRRCKVSFIFEGLKGSQKHCQPEGIFCTCGHRLTDTSVMAQLENQIRQQTCKYYESWLICDDQACGNRTRQMSVYGQRCLGPQALGKGCLGKMRYEYSEKMIYNQLLYFMSLFEVDKAKDKCAEAEREQLTALAEHNRNRFEILRGITNGYLDKCGRQWVSMDSLFGRLGF
ncbi:unnamed protein product [Blumeria hordei]|uniref:DNA polymerase n=1 Tax=Blumeria hordei TaxID=2867405 RepID=A0A383UW47_BLUHO|nr:unnamed protein product [Blumeria hordei]